MNMTPQAEGTYLSEHVFQGEVIQKQLPRIRQPLVFGALKIQNYNGNWGHERDVYISMNTVCPL